MQFVTDLRCIISVWIARVQSYFEPEHLCFTNHFRRSAIDLPTHEVTTAHLSHTARISHPGTVACISLNHKLILRRRCPRNLSHVISRRETDLGHLPLKSKGKVGCEALSSPTKLKIFRVFDFSTFYFRFVHFAFWLHNWPSKTFFHIILMRLTHLDMCFCLTPILNVKIPEIWPFWKLSNRHFSNVSDVFGWDPEVWDLL